MFRILQPWSGTSLSGISCAYFIKHFTYCMVDDGISDMLHTLNAVNNSMTGSAIATKRIKSFE